MRLFIFSTQPEINTIFHDHFTSKGYLCITFNKMEDFLTSLDDNSNPPLLMILDYLIYNHDIFSIYKFMKEKQCNFPCLFYNDPCLTRGTRKSHWKAQIELLQNHNNKIDFEKIDSVLQDLQTLVENKTISPSIRLMQEPLPLPKELIAPKITLSYIQNYEDDGIEAFKDRNNLSKSLFKLLQLFQENQNVKLTLQEIQKLYNDRENTNASEKSVYVMISKLKSILRTDKEAKFIIRKEGELYNFIKFSSR
ncbi:MAG: helix-turn-helix domain-containing protein [Treponema sp.]|nr:helix-turn-helix domain-containing protein [Treponema sp.]